MKNKIIITLALSALFYAQGSLAVETREMNPLINQQNSANSQQSSQQNKASNTDRNAPRMTKSMQRAVNWAQSDEGRAAIRSANSSSGYCAPLSR